METVNSPLEIDEHHTEVSSHSPSRRVVYVTFSRAGALVPYDPGRLELNLGDLVVVEHESGGDEIGIVVKGPVEVPADQLPSFVDAVKRKATERDLARAEENRKLAREAFSYCLHRISVHNLPMKLIHVNVTLNRKKIIFYFTAEERVDFRNLVRDLARKYKTRVDMKQIGIRDEAKMVGGIGPCGRIICCASVLRSFDPVSIRMAKDQYVILNPTKISGLCGRLVCCLGFEHSYYKEMCQYYPKIGDTVETVDGIKGHVVSVNIMDRKVFISVEGDKGQVAVPRRNIKGLPPLAEEEEAHEAAEEREEKKESVFADISFRDENESLEAKLEEVEREAERKKQASSSTDTAKQGQQKKKTGRERGKGPRQKREAKSGNAKPSVEKTGGKGGHQGSKKVKGTGASAEGRDNSSQKRAQKNRNKRFYLRRSKGGRNKGNKNG